MKVLCVGDSLGLPREGVEFEETWVYKLRKANPDDDFISCFVRNLTSKDLFKSKGIKGDFSYYYNPDVVILQLGVCDCAPRYYNNRKTRWKIIEKVGKSVLSEPVYWKIVKKYLKRNIKSVYVGLESFSYNIDRYFDYLINDLSVKSIIVIQIGTPEQNVLKKSPLFFEQIRKYNDVYIQLSGKYNNKVIVVNPLSEGRGDCYVDGYHTNGKGAQLVFEAINKQLKKIKNN